MQPHASEEHERKIGLWLATSTHKVRNQPRTILERRNDALMSWRRFIVSLSLEQPSSLFFANASPLFEEEWDLSSSTLVADIENPGFLDGASVVAAFASDDDPIDALERHGAEIFEQGFDR